jgi:hypothetical protein
MIIYDCEIIKAIPGKDKRADDLLKKEGILFCGGWRDFDNMGISVIGAYDYYTDRYRVFCFDNFDDFRRLVDEHDQVIGFNSISFDNPLCRANSIDVPDDKSYDILVEIWKAAGLSPKFAYPSHSGFGLDACCHANFRTTKTGNGALAPVDWQRNNIGSVIDYCINDVKLTKQLTDQLITTGAIYDPRNLKRSLYVQRRPGEHG